MSSFQNILTELKAVQELKYRNDDLSFDKLGSSLYNSAYLTQCSSDARLETQSVASVQIRYDLSGDRYRQPGGGVPPPKDAHRLANYDHPLCAPRSRPKLQREQPERLAIARRIAKLRRGSKIEIIGVPDERGVIVFQQVKA